MTGTDEQANNLKPVENKHKKHDHNPDFDPLVGHPHRKAILAVMCLSLIVIILDNSILNVAVPTISRELGASDKDLLWIIDAYTIIFAGLLLTAGTIGDKFGRRKILQSGLLFFGAASLLAAFAQSPTQLILGRGLMGIGGAAIMPATLSIITNVFPARERARAIGIWAGFAGIGGAVGPLTGGFLISHLNWWWGSVFLINVPIVVFGAIANALIVPESKDKNAPKIDFVGSILSIIALCALLYGIIMGSEEGYTQQPIIIAFVISAVTFAAFFFWETKIDEPMLQLQFFEDRRFSAGATTIMFIFFAMFGMTLLLTQYLQLVLGYDALKSGAAFIPFAVTMFFTAPSSAKIAQRIGTKTTVCIGLTLATIALLSLTTVHADSRYIDIVWMFVLMAMGMGLAMTPSTSSIMNSLPREKAGVGSAMNDTTRMMGAALGLAIIGSVTASVYRHKIEMDTKLSALKEQVFASPMPKEESKNLFSTISSSVGKAIGQARVLMNTEMITDPTARAKIEAIPEPIRKNVGETITHSAQNAFIPGIHAGMRVAAIAMGIALLVALIWMPQNAMTEDQKAGTAH